MKKIFIFMVLILFAMPAFANVLVEFTNPVQIKTPDGSDITPAIGLDLPIESIVSTGVNGKATLMDDMGAFVVLNQNESLKIGSDEERPLEQKGAIRALAVAMKDATSSSEGPTVYGMVKRGTSSSFIARPLDPLPYHAIYPVSVAVEKPQPIIFKWNVDQNRKGVYLILENSKKVKLVERAIDFNSGEISIGPKPFVQGERYSWWLAKKEQDKLVPLMTKNNFHILETAKLNQLNADISAVKKIVLSEKSRNLLLGQLYYSYGFYDKTTEYLVPIYKEQPTDFLKTILLRSFYNQRLPQKADELGLTAPKEEFKDKYPMKEERKPKRRGKM